MSKVKLEKDKVYLIMEVEPSVVNFLFPKEEDWTQGGEEDWFAPIERKEVWKRKLKEWAFDEISGMGKIVSVQIGDGWSIV